MTDTVNFEGVKATVQKPKFKFFSIVFLAITALVSTNCSTYNANNTTPAANGVDPNETAATVNGKPIKLEEVERVIKQQGQGQEARLSPLELAKARLQVLETLIQNEVLYQKAEKENVNISEDDVTVEFNRQKTESGMSADQIAKDMQASGLTEAAARENIKKQLAIQELIKNVTGKIEPPKDSEIEAFYNGNKDAFVSKRGVKLAAIVIDPANNGEGDTTTNEQEAVLKGNEIIKELQQGKDFAALARENSEDQSRLQGGDLGYISEDEMKQTFPAQVAATLMDPKFSVGQILPTPMQGKFYIFKLQERNDKDENLTLESPGVRQKVTDALINARKELLKASYAAVAMNDAKIENYLARKVVENPNELSGARPAVADTPQVETNANVNANANPAGNTNANLSTNAANKPAVNANSNTK